MQFKALASILLFLYAYCSFGSTLTGATGNERPILHKENLPQIIDNANKYINSSTMKTTILQQTPSLFCSQFQDCEKCLKDHVNEHKILGTLNETISNCNFKICHLTPNQFFAVCYTLDGNVECPANITASNIVTEPKQCNDLIKEHIAEPDKILADINITTTTTPSSASNLTTDIITTLVPQSTTNTNTSTTTITPHTTNTTNTTTVTTPTTNTTTTPTLTPVTTVPTNATTVTPNPHPTNSTTHGPSPITPAPHRNPLNKFSASSFFGGVFVTGGAFAVGYFALKYYRNNIRYRQF